MTNKPKIYLETTIISYLTARPSRDVVIAGRQETTREKWSQIVQDYIPYISALVIQEARKGDPLAAQKRLEAIQVFPVLDITSLTQTLAAQLLTHHGIPAEYPEDALHIKNF